MRVKADLFW